MDTCVACGADLGVGRFCLNCGHPIGAPAPSPREVPVAATAPTADPTADPETDAATVQAPAPPDQPSAQPPPVESSMPPVQAADPTPVPPTSPPDVRHDEPPAAHPRREWDPREELLPYEEVDDPDADVPVRGKAWIAWVGAAVLLVALALVLMRVFATADDVATDPAAATDGAGSDDSTSQEAGSTAADAEVPRGVGAALDLARGASFEVPATAPPTTDLDGSLVSYEAAQMGDGDPATAWRTAGDATGQTITVTLAEPGVVTRVGLVNGYAKQVAGVDWYPHNRRILAVTWGFDDGSSVEQALAERPGLQRRKVPPVETSAVTITFDAVTPPGAGALGRDYTAISEVSLRGRRAG